MQSLWMLVAGLAFALMGVCVKWAAPHFAAAELVFYRALVQVVFAYALLARQGLSIRTPHFGMHVHRGVAGFVSLFTFFYALTTLPVATAVTLSYTSPVFLTILLAWFARERLGPPLIATIGLGFAGCALLLQPTFAEGQTWPALVGLSSGFMSAVAYWNIRVLVRNDEPAARIVFYFGICALLGALLWMAPQAWHVPTPADALPIAGLGIFGVIGQFAMTRAYGHGRALVTAALSYSGVVFSSMLGIVFFGDLLAAASWVGMALVVAAGIIAVQLQPGARKEPASQLTND
jgi:S-adenosylmethionine uptake transporter